MLSSFKIWKQNYDTQDLFKRQVRTFIILFIGYASLHSKYFKTSWDFEAFTEKIKEIHNEIRLN